MLECPFVDSFLCGPLDGSTARIGVLDHVCWLGTYARNPSACPVRHCMPWPHLPRPGTHVFRVRLCSAFCTQQQSTHFYLLCFLFFIFRRVASGACQVNRTDDRFASSSTRDSLRYPATYQTPERRTVAWAEGKVPRKPRQSLAFSTLFESFASRHFSHSPGRIALVFDILVQSV